MAELFEHVTEYVVSVLPFDHEEHPYWTVDVQRRSKDRWAVVRNGRVLNADGLWSGETQDDRDDDEWLAAHRFDLDTALSLARQVAPTLRSNGLSVLEVLDGAR